MNILILTFGNDMCQKYNREFLIKQFSRGNHICIDFDILSYEYEMHEKSTLNEIKDFHSLFRSHIMMKKRESVEDRICGIISDNNIDAVISLSNTAVEYIDKVCKSNRFSISVYSVIVDSDLKVKTLDSIEKYVVFSDKDSRKLAEQGIDGDKIIKSGLFGISDIIASETAQNMLNMFLEHPVTVFVTRGTDDVALTKFFNAYMSSLLKNTNLIVLFTENNHLCCKFFDEYCQCENIGIIFHPDAERMYIAAADFVVLDSGTDSAMCALVNHKPLIVFENSYKDKAYLKLLVRNRYAACEKNPEDIVKQLEYAVTDDRARNNYIYWQNELHEIMRDDILYNYVINNKLHKERQRQ